MRRITSLMVPCPRWLALSLIVGCLMLSLSPNLATGASPASVSPDVDVTSPGVQTSAAVPLGADVLSIDVAVTGALPTGAFEFELFYNPAYLTLVDIAEGAFLERTGRSASCVESTTYTTVHFACTTAGQVPPAASGDGVLARLTFRPRVVGYTCLSVSHAELSDVFGSPLPVTTGHACITILPDRDRDGVADTTDNCPDHHNPAQHNTDARSPVTDTLGDACDLDDDNDTCPDVQETANRAALRKPDDPHDWTDFPDSDHDGTVGFGDLVAFGATYTSTTGDPGFDPRFDFDANGAITFSDFVRFAATWQRQCAPGSVT